MLCSISSTDIVKSRSFFGQTITPKKGAIVASPVLGSYDPDPDYFFHWYRDSAIVVDALRLLYVDGTLGREAIAHFADFIRFSESLRTLDGRVLAKANAWRERTLPDHVQFLRSNDDLASVHGERVAADARVNPDATLDISRWSRPQNDGAALRALAVLRWMDRCGVDFDATVSDAATRLLRSDLAFTLHRHGDPCFDIWEEEEAHHYYTLCVQSAALDEGAAWLSRQGALQEAESCGTAAIEIRRRLEGYWLEDEGFYRSRMTEAGSRSHKDLDMAVVLASLHAASKQPTHSVHDPKMAATLTRLEALFEAEYPINHGRGSNAAPAMGRYAGDTYYSGGPYYFSTLAAAEFYFHAGAAILTDVKQRLKRGDAFLETVRRYTPQSGAMSEQFDRRTGEPSSAKHLAWSYAAFITCVSARRSCRARI